MLKAKGGISKQTNLTVFNMTICDLSSGVITLTASGGHVYMFIWKPVSFVFIRYAVVLRRL